MASTALVAQSEGPRPGVDDHDGPAPYKHQCVAMGIKPNSRLVRNEAALLDQTKLDFSLNYIGSGGLQATTDAISQNRQLESLILAGNGLNNESVVFLCRALKDHPALKYLDLSNNPVSLPAGLALIELVRGNGVIREIKLQGTLVDEPVQGKIRRLLNINRSKREKSEAQAAAHGNTNSSAPTVTPFQRAVREHEQKSAKRRLDAVAQKASLEKTAAVGVTEELRAMSVHAPERGADGWAVLQLFISAAPHGFAT
jgi:hypothetical protein